MKTIELTVYSDGYKYWIQNDELHREDGPAIEWTNGYKEWYINGELHRLDGPAVEKYNGEVEYWYKETLCAR